MTRLAALASSGDDLAAKRLYSEVYEQLRSLARSYFRGQPRGHTLQPTGLVHEAFLRLFEGGGLAWKDRAHLPATAASAMRHI
ncbi:MAG: ECF-type sigma factor, partial [Planctomycetota bacterium]